MFIFLNYCTGDPYHFYYSIRPICYFTDNTPPPPGYQENLCVKTFYKGDFSYSELFFRVATPNDVYSMRIETYKLIQLTAISESIYKTNNDPFKQTNSLMNTLFPEA
ncbi:hypothetical protein M2326_000426 [Flavobacterium sp. 7A]|nr:hypothetical protein [Flavobacterium sp. 7A]